MARLLYLTTEFPLPSRSGGRARSLSQLDLLATLVDEIAVCSVAEEDVPQALVSELGARIRRGGAEARILPPVAHPVHVRHSVGSLAKVAAYRVASRQPYVLAKWMSRSMDRMLDDVLRERWDVVFLDHLASAAHLRRIRRSSRVGRIVLEEHNVETEFFDQFAARAPRWIRPLAQLEARATRRAEAAALSEVDAVVTISASDARGLADLVGSVKRMPAPLHVVAPAVRPAADRPARQRSVPNFSFVGTLSWEPNRQGVEWLAATVWPIVRSLEPDAQLSIVGSGLPVGRDGSVEVPAAWAGPGVEVVGYVDVLEPVYRGSVAVVCPSFGGSGVRMKLLEAFHFGVPVVTNVDGAHGLDVTDDVELFVADDPHAFARRVVELWRSPEVGERMVVAADRYLVARHDPKAARAALRTALDLPDPGPMDPGPMDR